MRHLHEGGLGHLLLDAHLPDACESRFPEVQLAKLRLDHACLIRLRPHVLGGRAAFYSVGMHTWVELLVGYCYGLHLILIDCFYVIVLACVLVDWLVYQASIYFSLCLF